MSSNFINLVIVDGQIMFRKTLQRFLAEQPNLQVIFQTENISELLTRLESLPVDVLIMDVFSPNGHFNAALDVIRNKYPTVKILVLSMCADMDLICGMLQAGIYGYISKTDEPEELIRAIVSAASGQIYRNKVFTEALYLNSQNKIRSYANDIHLSLSDREKKIFQLMWEEKSNKEIAEELFLGVRSIEKIRQDLKEKIGVKSTVGLIKYAISKNVIGSYL